MLPEDDYFRNKNKLSASHLESLMDADEFEEETLSSKHIRLSRERRMNFNKNLKSFLFFTAEEICEMGRIRRLRKRSKWKD